MDRLTATEQLARDVVQTVAADELQLFDEVVVAARRPGAVVPKGEDVLGVGIDAAAVLTPLIISLVKFAVGAGWKMVSPALAKQAAGPLARIRVLLHKVPVLWRLVPPEQDPVGLPTLNPEQLEELREVVEARAKALGTSAPESSLLAEAVVGRLALAQA